MLLLSRESADKMNAKLLNDEKTQSQDNSFVLEESFTKYHQINLVVEDLQKQ
jgi:hypothetical protein